MKLYALFAVLFFSVKSFSQNNANVVGNWQGKLDIGKEFRVIFHFNKTTDSTYTGTMDSPDQGGKDIPFDSIVVRGDSLVAQAKEIGGMFTGLVLKDTMLLGRWNQGKNFLGLVLYKMKE